MSHSMPLILLMVGTDGVNVKKNKLYNIMAKSTLGLGVQLVGKRYHMAPRALYTICN